MVVPATETQRLTGMLLCASKVCANALYGFTGSPASPLCCGPLAEACIFTGSQLCHRARGIIETEAAIDLAAGIPGMPKVPKVARVIYGQTDSLMVLFPSATPAQAVEAGEYLAGEVRCPCAMWCSPRRPQRCACCADHTAAWSAARAAGVRACVSTFPARSCESVRWYRVRAR